MSQLKVAGTPATIIAYSTRTKGPRALKRDAPPHQQASEPPLDSAMTKQYEHDLNANLEFGVRCLLNYCAV